MGILCSNLGGQYAGWTYSFAIHWWYQQFCAFYIESYLRRTIHTSFIYVLVSSNDFVSKLKHYQQKKMIH